MRIFREQKRKITFILCKGAGVVWMNNFCISNLNLNRVGRVKRPTSIVHLIDVSNILQRINMEVNTNAMRYDGTSVVSGVQGRNSQSQSWTFQCTSTKVIALCYCTPSVWSVCGTHKTVATFIYTKIITSAECGQIIVIYYLVFSRSLSVSVVLLSMIKYQANASFAFSFFYAISFCAILLLQLFDYNHHHHQHQHACSRSLLPPTHGRGWWPKRYICNSSLCNIS